MRVGWFVATALGAAAAAFGVLHAQDPPPGPAAEGTDGSQWQTVTGTSNEGDLEAALQAAVREASELVNRSGADRMVVWEVEKISGRQGGFAGFRQVSVTIRFPRDPR